VVRETVERFSKGKEEAEWFLQNRMYKVGIFTTGILTTWVM
jgi:hypothetical protein